MVADRAAATAYYAVGEKVWAVERGSDRPREVCPGVTAVLTADGKELLAYRRGTKGWELWRVPVSGG